MSWQPATFTEAERAALDLLAFGAACAFLWLMFSQGLAAQRIIERMDRARVCVQLRVLQQAAQAALWWHRRQGPERSRAGRGWSDLGSRAEAGLAANNGGGTSRRARFIAALRPLPRHLRKWLDYCGK